MLISDMVNRDNIFKSIMREFKSELSSFENLHVIPDNIYESIIEPLLTTSCNSFIKEDDIFYSISKERSSYDKSIAKLEIDIGLYIAYAIDFRFKHYKIMLSFGGTGK